MLWDDRGAVCVYYGVFGLPEAFFMRPGFVIVQKFIGALTEDDFRSMLDEILNDVS